jgi:hypothetical protein
MSQPPDDAQVPTTVTTPASQPGST